MTENNIKSKPEYPTIFVAVVILIVIALAASLLYFFGFTTSQPASSTSGSNSSSRTSIITGSNSSTTTTTSATVISTTSSTGRLSGSGATILSKTWGPWSYTVSINATSVNVGEKILIRGMLTYMGQNSTTRVAISAPYAHVRDLNAGGKLVWDYISGGVYYPKEFSKGETASSNVYIPTSGFKPGIYSIDTEPNFSTYPDFQDLGANLQIKANFTVIASSTTTKKTFDSATATNTTTTATTTTTTAATAATGLTSLCWSTYQHDYQRTSYSAGKAPLSNNTLWVNSDAHGAFASPIVADDKVFIYTGGYTYAIDALTGSTFWKVSSSIGVQPQLTYYNGSIIQGTRSSGLEIIDVATGNSSFIQASKVLSAGGGAPIVDNDGVVYFGENHLRKLSPTSSDSTFFAYYLKNRTKLWEFSLPTGEQIVSSPTITVDERIIIFSAQHGLHALNATNGKQLWMFNTSSERPLSGASVSGGRIFAVGADGFIYALNQQNGSIGWRTQIASSIGNANSPAVGGGKVFVSDGHKVYALNSANGTIVWASSNLGDVRSSPTVSGGLVFAVSSNGVLHTLKENNGSTAWRLQLQVKYGATLTSVAVCDGIAFTASDEGVRAVGAAP